jgi:hypothetical protein
MVSEPAKLLTDPEALKRHLDGWCAAPEVFHQEFTIALAGENYDAIGVSAASD